MNLGAKNERFQRTNKLFLVLVLIIVLDFCNFAKAVCPEKCVCKKINENEKDTESKKITDRDKFLKVKCSNVKLNSLKELDFEEDFENVMHLDLSKNSISYIDQNEFVNYTNLRRLDLSSNALKQIDQNMFGEIPSMERLKLTSNLIVHIFQGSFENMKNLKQL